MTTEKTLFTLFMLFVAIISITNTVGGLALRATAAIPLYWIGMIDKDTATHLALWHIF